MAGIDRTSGELQREIKKFQEQVLPTVPKEILDALMSTTADQVRSGIAEKALKEGATAPDFSTTNVRGEPVRLAERLERGPAVVTFYRGGW